METIRTSTFWRDLKGFLDYFAEVRNESGALKLLDAVDETINFIEEFPDLGIEWESGRSRIKNIKIRLVQGFPNYLILYRREDDKIYVLRILDGRRNLEEIL